MMFFIPAPYAFLIKIYVSATIASAKIDANHTDTEAKVQELKAEVLMLTKSMSAVMDGLIQQGCNGPVTAAKKNLDEFLMSKL